MWTNIFDLGDVELYFAAEVDGTRTAIASLPSGTVTVVDGVIQCRDLPENVGGGGVGYIIAVPQNPLLVAGEARVSIANISVPEGSGGGGVFEFDANVSSDPPDADDDGATFVATVEDDVVTGLTPTTEVEIGEVPRQTSTLPQLVWGYNENEAA